MIPNKPEIVIDNLAKARLDCINKFSEHLSAEITLAKNGNGFYERKYYSDYLLTKFAHQKAMNEFYNALHDLSK